MELDDLKVLIQLSDHGSIRGVAQKLDVSRSALRRQLERLEQAFGTPLVMREGRGVQLTAAGAHAVARARPLLSEAGAMVEEARAKAGRASGVVRMLIPVGMPATMRIQALNLLLARHPQLALDMREVPDPLRWTHLPFEMIGHFGPAPATVDLISSVLAESKRQLMASPAYVEQHGTPGSIEELVEHRLVVWRCPGRPVDQLPRIDGSWVPVQPWLISSDLNLVLEAAARGLGLAFLPTVVAVEHSLAPILEHVVVDRVSMHVSSRRPSRVDPQVAALLRNIHDLLSGNKLIQQRSLQPH